MKKKVTRRRPRKEMRGADYVAKQCLKSSSPAIPPNPFSCASCGIIREEKNGGLMKVGTL
jgi:hypothetical protein